MGQRQILRMMIVTEAREVYSRRKAELKTPSPSQDISLSRSSLAELENWLSPLSEFMDLEREALLKNVLSGSRVWLLKRVFKFLSPDDPSAGSTNRVMWLRGVAGVGKSVMAAMVSRELQAQGMLGGLFFCKHDDDRRSSAQNLVLTLVFGLAKFSLQYGEILLQVKQDNPDILSRSVFEMMKVLLVQPLKKVVESKKLNVPLVLVVDALDECGAIGKRNETLAVFQELNRLLPVNVKMLVTGRPEVDIVKAFEKIPFEEIEPTAEENTQDQIEFTRNFLWSSNAEQSVVNEGSELLVSKSAGIFVWLVTACTYLRKLETEEITLEQIKDLTEGDKMDGSIDLMYDRIFNGILQSIKASTLESLLGAVLSIIVLAYEPLTAAAIVSLLDNEIPENVMMCIRMLDPILVARWFH
ncbi:hypothetical protein DFJ73DRAFT_471268 [Zopfochytrium polystomum]|nr:hypothetical protein DFJ73DRAFT_471268 [Zopfochytrium polystomum]